MIYTAWTAQRPTSVGFYFYRNDESELFTVAEVTSGETPGDEKLVQIIGDEEWHLMSDMPGEWQGPIVPGD